MEGKLEIGLISSSFETASPTHLFCSSESAGCTVAGLCWGFSGLIGAQLTFIRIVHGLIIRVPSEV